MPARMSADIPADEMTAISSERASASVVSADEVRDEAERRILAIIPEWKQRNLIAHAAVLAETGRSNWSASDLAAWQAGEAIWAQVKLVRDASDALEATPGGIPADYKDDGYWP